MTTVAAIPTFHADNNSALLKFKQKTTGVAGDNGTRNVEIMVSLKYLSNFWTTLEMPLINCKINLILIWSDKCVLPNDTKATTIVITDTKLYVPFVTLSTQDNANLFEELKSGFQRTIIGNKYESKESVAAPKPYLDFIINPIFQAVNRLIYRTVHAKYYLSLVELKNYNVMIDRRNFFDRSVKKQFNNIW